MTGPLAQTFQLLTATANPFAGELLIAALDVPVLGVQSEAIESILSRGGVREQMEAIRRYPRFRTELRRPLEQAAQSLVPAIRQCLLVGRGELETAALELARAGGAFGLLETLLDILRGDRSEKQEHAVDAIRHLVNRLYDALQGHSNGTSPLKNAGQIQHMTVMALDKSLAYFYNLSHPEVVIESLFALAGPAHAATQKLLTQGSPECRALAKDVLMTSTHPGVMRFLLDSMSRPYPSARILEALQEREDPEFVVATLRWVPKRWNSTQERNLKQIEQIAWLKRGTACLEVIPEELQSELVTYASATGINRDLKQRIRQWVVRNGSPAARTAAVAESEDLDSEVVKEVVLDGLDSESPDVQAWATGQLRNQQVPDALNKLIEQLDNPEASVQAVARQELQGFDLECLLTRMESMSRVARNNAGGLLQKIDPECLGKLMDEFQHPIRRRRLRAIRGSLAFGWHVQVVPALLEMLKDEDPLIRRTTIEVLAHIPAQEVIASLTALKDDPSDRVRDTLEQALTKLAAQEIIPLEIQPL